jgi:hypothetical protein
MLYQQKWLIEGKLSITWSIGEMSDIFKDLEQKKEATIELSYFSWTQAYGNV